MGVKELNITIENWGPVQKCEFDLKKSLIVVYGNNNIGKSYAMQALYLLLKNLLLYASGISIYASGLLFYFEDSTRGLSAIEELVMNFDESGMAEKDVTEDLLNLIADSMEKEFLPKLRSSFQNTFGTYNLMLEKDPVFTITSERLVLRIRMQENKIDLKFQVKPVRLKTSESDFHKHREQRSSYTVYVCKTKISTPSELLEKKMNDMKGQIAFDVYSQVQAVYFLPASRSGIYAGMSSFGPILAQLSQSRAFINGKIQIPNIPEPISDYYMALSTIKPRENIAYRNCVDEIEETILKGKVRFDTKRKSIVYNPTDMDVALEMSDVSSMVSEISPITAFLKYVVNGVSQYRRKVGVSENSIIFIEEPEAHLHPSNQIALIKSLAKLSKQNVQLVMASHSNYIFNQLNNMIMNKELDSDSYLPLLMRAENGVSVSECMPMDEFGVDDENFADVSSQLMEERENILARMMEDEALDEKD